MATSPVLPYMGTLCSTATLVKTNTASNRHMDEPLAWTGDIDRLGALVSTIGSREFGVAFYELFRELLNIEECTVFSFPDPASPRQLIAEGDSDAARDTARKLALDYISGGYREDPNVQQHRADARQTNIYVMDADDIGDAQYRKHYYGDHALQHELVLLGREGDTLYYTSFYRKQNEAEFSRDEISKLKGLASFVVKILHRHSELVSPSGNEAFNFVPAGSVSPGDLRERTLEHLRDVLVSGPHKLSQREAEVCAGIVMGYSTLAISLNCSISPNTVATHRKRAYAKLGISSQNELFVRYFSTVREFQAKYAQ